MLTSDVVEAPSLNAFKSRLEQEWRQYRSSQKSMRECFIPMSHRDEKST